MKKFILIFFAFGFYSDAFSQTNADEIADSAYIFPDSLCLSCNGSVWQNPMNATIIPPSGYSRAFLLPYNQCNQDTCYYTREFRFCNYGFNIPANASIDSFWVYISEGAFAPNAVVDTVAQLMKNHTPVGNNYAYPYTWLSNQSVYYPPGLFGTTWTALEINDPGFGLLIIAKNISNDTVSARIISSHITVWYNTSNGVFSQTSEQNLFTFYPNPFSYQTTMELPVQELTFVLYNVLGEEIRRIENIHSPKIIIRRNDLPGGIYFYKILDNNYILNTGKLVVY